MNTLIKTAVIATIAFAGFAGVGSAQTVMRSGTSNQIGPNHVADNKWYQIGKVTIGPKYRGVCAVFANGHTDANGQDVDYTISTSANPPSSSWHQVNWDSNRDWRMWHMHQNFAVKGGAKYAFYVHARSRLGNNSTTIKHQVTQVTAICGKGGNVKSDHTATGRGGDGPNS